MMTALVTVVGPVALASALFWIGVGYWWQYLADLDEARREREAEERDARRTPITGRSDIAEFSSALAAFRLRQMAGRR